MTSFKLNYLLNIVGGLKLQYMHFAGVTNMYSIIVEIERHKETISRCQEALQSRRKQTAKAESNYLLTEYIDIEADLEESREENGVFLGSHTVFRLLVKLMYPK